MPDTGDSLPYGSRISLPEHLQPGTVQEQSTCALLLRARLCGPPEQEEQQQQLRGVETLLIPDGPAYAVGYGALQQQQRQQQQRQQPAVAPSSSHAAQHSGRGRERTAAPEGGREAAATAAATAAGSATVNAAVGNAEVPHAIDCTTANAQQARRGGECVAQGLSAVAPASCGASWQAGTAAADESCAQAQAILRPGLPLSASEADPTAALAAPVPTGGMLAGICSSSSIGNGSSDMGSRRSSRRGGNRSVAGGDSSTDASGAQHQHNNQEHGASTPPSPCDSPSGSNSSSHTSGSSGCGAGSHSGIAAGAALPQGPPAARSNRQHEHDHDPRGYDDAADAAARRFSISISACRTWQHLVQLLHTRDVRSLNVIHHSIALNRLSRIRPPRMPPRGHDPSAPGPQLVSLLTGLYATLPGHLSSIWAAGAAAATALATGPGRHWPSFDQQMTPRQLANAVGSLARLQHLLPPPVQLLHMMLAAARSVMCSFTAPELTELLWALATMGHRPSKHWLRHACEAALQRLHEHSPRELATTLWALARLRYWPGDPWVTAWLQHAATQMGHASAYDVSQSLWALGSLEAHTHEGVLPAIWVTSVLERAEELLRPAATAAAPRSRWAGSPAVCGDYAPQQHPALAPQDVCNALHGIASLGLPAPPELVAGAVSAVAAQEALLARCRPVDIAHLLWAFTVLRYKPRRGVVARLEIAVLERAPHFTAVDLGQVFWAFGRIKYRPSVHTLRALASRWAVLLSPAAAPAASSAAEAAAAGDELLPSPPPPPQTTLMALWACIRLGLCLSDALLARVLFALQRSAGRCTPREAALAVYLLAAWRQRGWELPVAACRPMLAAMVRRALDAMTEGGGCLPRTLPVLLWSIAQLRWPVSEAWVRQVLVQSVETLPLLTSREAAVVVWSLVQLRCQPPPLWLGRMQQLALRQAEAIAQEREVALSIETAKERVKALWDLTVKDWRLHQLQTNMDRLQSLAQHHTQQQQQQQGDTHPPASLPASAPTAAVASELASHPPCSAQHAASPAADAAIGGSAAVGLAVPAAAAEPPAAASPSGPRDAAARCVAGCRGGSSEP